MIKKLIGRLLGRSDAAKPAKEEVARIPLGKRVEVVAAEHGIDPQLLDDRAVKVVATLKEAGHEAYIVGGAVRDLLVGRRPKDFDVATSATPEQVKASFRRAFIVGRRFRIVHVVHGRGREHEVIEVSTFRAYLDAAAADQVDGSEKSAKSELVGKTHVVDASGRVLRDNVWGPQIEDAARRDFTVNAMYYDPTTQIVVDYHGGLADARAKVLRMIGDPTARYREDPVRLIRALRFAAKLDFSIEPKTRTPMAACAALLDNVPPSRMFDEMIKLMQTGHALRSVEQLRAHGFTHVFPMLHAVFGPQAALSDPERLFIQRALEDTDERVADDRAVAPSFLLASLLWHEVARQWQRARAGGKHPVPALHDAIDTVFDARIGDVSGRGKLGADMREIWSMQPRFERRTGATPFSLVDQARYRAGYDFLRLRADAGEIAPELADWWEDFALGSDEEREALMQTLRERAGPKRVRGAGAAAPRAASLTGRGADDASPTAPSGAPSEPRGSRHPDGDDDEPQADAPNIDDDQGAGGAAEPAKRRRRRRRKPRATSPSVASDVGDAE
jgi:poly(A) polymerase